MVTAAPVVTALEAATLDSPLSQLRVCPLLYAAPAPGNLPTN